MLNGQTTLGLLVLDPQLEVKPMSTNKTISSPDDVEMAVEYDFTPGTRGRYHSRYPGNNLPTLPGVHFMTDTQGRKIVALLDWQERRQRWQALISNIEIPPDVSYWTDANGNKIAICLAFDQHLNLWTAIYD